MWLVNRYEKEYRLIERLHGLQHRKVQTVVIAMPVAEKVKNASLWEMILAGNRWNNFNAVMRNYTEYFPISGLDPRYTPKLFAALGNVKQMGLRGYSVQVDRRSEHVNIINHIRPATDIPISAYHNIHIVGDSTAAGFYSTDNDTIASYLQRLTNTMGVGSNVVGGGEQYAVLIYAASGVSVHFLQLRIGDITAVPDDIVVVVGCGAEKFLNGHFSLSCAENGVAFYDTQQEYDRPHSAGEVFISGHHPNHRGNKKAAEIIYDRLFIHRVQLPMPPLFKHYLCGSSNATTGASVVAIPVSIPPRVSKTPPKTDADVSGADELSSSSEFQAFIHSLKYLHDSSQAVDTYGAGAIVMNCNPFTLGHLYLIEHAAAEVGASGRLYVFVVEEDRSEFPFTERFSLVQAGTAHLTRTSKKIGVDNTGKRTDVNTTIHTHTMADVVVLPSSRFIISDTTLPEYFVKGSSPDVRIDATLDLEIFCRWIVPTLNIRIRFVGEEPLDRVTLQYNRAMQTTLPQCGVSLRVIPRVEVGGAPISASRVRALLKEIKQERRVTREKKKIVEKEKEEAQWNKMSGLVPPTTLAYLRKMCDKDL